MRGVAILAVATVVVLGLGCSVDDPVEVEPAATAAPAAPAILEHPFSAEQIRDEWTPGLRLRIHRWTAEAEAYERWTVVAGDHEGVDIEAVAVDAEGTSKGEAQVQHSTWVQLRDHASFPADGARRERATRETPLGEHEGWLYVVDGPADGTVSEFFFADALPGAPLFVRVLRDGELVELFEQVDRARPEPGAGQRQR